MNTSDSLDSQSMSPRGPKKSWLYVLLIVAIALSVPTFLGVGWFFMSRRAPAPQTSVVVASFLADFQPDQPKADWRYYWNENGPVGDTNAYAELRWSGKSYLPTDTTSPAGRFVQLSNRAGHPGQGPAQNIRDDNEHAVIIAFTVAESGRYVIRESFISRNDGAAGGAVHLRVFVNSREVSPDFYCRTQEKTSFDRELGKLAARDSIYVCIGPGESDYHDSFTIDFSIGRF